jgi:hypothetical protein
LQIFLGADSYRRLADRAIGWLHIGLRETDSEKVPVRTAHNA